MTAPIGSTMLRALLPWLHRPRRTFVVLGCPRGGTSLVAGALNAAGVYMGDYRTLQYEDPDFKIAPRQADQAVGMLTPVIRSRNRAYRYWGWKAPNNIYYIEKIAHLLINPHFLFVYRDPVQIARSSAKHDGRDWSAQREALLRVAHNHSERVRRFQASLASPHDVFQLEAIHADPRAFADRIIALVRPLAAERETVLRFVRPEGGYHAHAGTAPEARGAGLRSCSVAREKR